MFLWVGREAVPQLVMDVFDLPSYAELRGGKVWKPCVEIIPRPVVLIPKTLREHFLS